MEIRKFSDTELLNIIGDIIIEFPKFSHRQIANHIYLEHKIPVSSTKVFSILRKLKKNSGHLHTYNSEQRKAKRNKNSQKNPKWHRDEIILALDLYFSIEPGEIKAKNPKIIQLSEKLNLLSIHLNISDSAKFRNPNGVSLKLCNFLALDPNYPGKGMSSYSKLDKSIWNEFHLKKDVLHKIAVSIIDSIHDIHLRNQNKDLKPSIVEDNIDDELLEQNYELISHLFSDNNYKLFVKYCKKRGLKYTSDLQNFDFNDLYKIRGLGVKKISNIIAIFEKNKTKDLSKPKPIDIKEIIATKPVCEKSLNYFPLYSNSKIGFTIVSFHPSYKIDDLLENLNLNLRSQHTLQVMKISKVGDLLFFTPNQLIRIRNCGKTTIKYLQKAMKKYLLTKDKDLSSKWHSFDSMIRSIIKISDRNLHILKNRLGINFSSPQTLEDTGSPFELTRERTRQILSNIYKKLNSDFSNNLLKPFWLSIDLILSKYHGFVDSNVLASEIIDLLDWDLAIEGHAILEFSKLYDKYVINHELQIIGMSGDNCLECKYRNEFINEIAKSYDQFTIDEISEKYFDFCKNTCSQYDNGKLLNPGQVSYQISKIDYSNFLVFKDNVFYTLEKYEEKKKIDRRNLLRENNSPLVLIEDYLESKISAVSADEIQIYLQNKGIIFQYSIASALQNSDFIFSWGRGSYIHRKNITVSDELLDRVKTHLNSRLEDGNNYIAIQKLYNIFEELCIDEDIPNQNAFYTVLSLFLYRSFQFHGYPLITSLSNTYPQSLPILLEHYILSFENGVEYNNVKDYFVNEIGIYFRSFRFQISNNPAILKQSNDLLIHKKYLLNSDDESNISQFSEALLSKRKLSEYVLQNHLEVSGIIKSWNVSLNSILASNKNVESINNMLFLNGNSIFYNLEESELFSKISKLDFKGLNNKSIHKYLLSELSNQEGSIRKKYKENPLDDILVEFGG